MTDSPALDPQTPDPRPPAPDPRPPAPDPRPPAPDPRPPTPDPRPPIPVLPILSINFVGTLGFSLVLPFLVFLVTRWGGNALVYGLMGATYSAFQLIGAPILGRWSDAYGRRRILLFSQIGTLISWGIFLGAMLVPVRPLLVVDSTTLGQFTLTLPLVVMFAARVVDGITGGNVSVAHAYLADISSEERRSENFGRMAVAANLGFILGPTIAGLLGSTTYGELLPVLAAFTISAVATVMIAVMLPESRPCVIETDPEQLNVRKVFGQEQAPCFEMGESRPSIRDVLGIRDVPRLLAVYFLVMLGFNFFYISFPVHAATRLAWTIADTGAFFTVMSLCMAVVQGPVLARASKRWSDDGLALVGSLILAASFVLFVAEAKPVIFAGAALLALGNGLMWPSVLSTLSKAAGSVHQGAVQGFASSTGSVASIVGLIVGGLLYDTLGSSVFLLSAGTIVVVCVLSLGARR